MQKKFAEFYRGWGPVYWSVPLYRAAMALLRPDHRKPLFKAVAAEIGALSVLDLCCGDGALQRWIPNNSYCGIDRNPVFAAHLHRRGLHIIQGNVLESPWPEADCVVMIDSLYHFQDRAGMLLDRMKRHARRKVIIAESIEHVAASPRGWLAATAVWATRVRGTRFPKRYTGTDLSTLLKRFGFSRPRRISSNLFGVFKK